MKIFIEMLLLSILLPLALKTKDTNLNDEDKIELKFNNTLKTIMLISSIFFYLLSLICTISIKNNDDNSEIIVGIMFLIFGIGSLFFYLYLKNKKIIYHNNFFYIYNIFGKQSVFNLNKLEKAISKPNNGLILEFKGAKKIKIDTQMNNYTKLIEILEKNNIVIKDKNGNKLQKGW